MTCVTKKLAVFLFAFCVALTGTPPFGTVSGMAAAAEEGKKEKPKTRRSEVLGKNAFKRIEQAQELMAEEQYEKAFNAVQGILDGERFKPYEKAVALQTMGVIHAAQGNYAKTIEAFEAAVAGGHLPPRMVSQLRYNLAQLYLAEGQTRKAEQLLTQWFAALDGEAAPEAYGLKAQVHLILDELTQAEQAVRKALSKVETPKQNWTRILLAVLLQQERLQEARPILEDAVERWPDVKVFWQQLTAIYYEADEDKLAFVAHRAMHIQGMLTSSKELSVMAQLYLYHNVPIKAAQILQTGMDSGKIEKSEENYDLLAQAYMHSREWSKSIAPLTKAAEKSDKGRFYEQLAQSYLQDEKWGQAEAALEKALKKGGLDDEANSWLLLGISRTRLGKYDAAIKAFRKAGDDDDVAKDAFRWIRSIERRLAEQKRQAEQRAAADG